MKFDGIITIDGVEVPHPPFTLECVVDVDGKLVPLAIIVSGGRHFADLNESREQRLARLN